MPFIPDDGSVRGHFLGYPLKQDDEFRYCQQPITGLPWALGTGVWRLDDCYLPGGASGGPAVTTADSKLYSVVSAIGGVDRNHNPIGPTFNLGPKLDSSTLSCLIHAANELDPVPLTFRVYTVGGTGPCLQRGFIWGDPHFKTFGGEYFDFMGACDLVLTETPTFDEGLGFAAHVRTKSRGQYSYIEAAVVKIGDDILEVGEYGFYVINGVIEGDLGSMGGKYKVTHTVADKKNSRFEIEIGNGEVIDIKVHKDLVSVAIDGIDKKHFQDAVGILGSYNGTRYSRSGEIMLDDNLYGQEWQVRPGVDPDLFLSKSEVEWPARSCVVPTALEKEERNRHLGESDVSIEAANIACKKFGAGTAAFEACVYDVLATNDLGAASSGAF